MVLVQDAELNAVEFIAGVEGVGDRLRVPMATTPPVGSGNGIGADPQVIDQLGVAIADEEIEPVAALLSRSRGGATDRRPGNRSSAGRRRSRCGDAGVGDQPGVICAGFHVVKRPGENRHAPLLPLWKYSVSCGASPK